MWVLYLRVLQERTGSRWKQPNGPMFLKELDSPVIISPVSLIDRQNIHILSRKLISSIRISMKSIETVLASG
jgi:hypothetical protein